MSFKKISSSTLLAMALSLGTNAMDQGQSQSQCGKSIKVEKCAKKAEKCSISEKASKGCADQAQDCDLSKSVAIDQIDDQCSDQNIVVEQQTHCGASITQEQCATQLGSQESLEQAIISNKGLSGIFAQGHRVRSHHMQHRVNFTQQNFQNDCFSDVNMTKVDFSQGNFNNVAMGGQFSKVKFKGANIQNSTFQGQIKGVNYAGSTMTNVDFRGAVFGTAGHLNHVHTSFEGATLENVNFAGATFNNQVSFNGAILKGKVSFEGAINAQNILLEGAKVQTLCNGINTLVTVTGEMAAHIKNDIKTLVGGGFTLAQIVAFKMHNVHHHDSDSDSSDCEDHHDHHDDHCHDGKI